MLILLKIATSASRQAVSVVVAVVSSQSNLSMKFISD